MPIRKSAIVSIVFCLLCHSLIGLTGANEYQSDSLLNLEGGVLVDCEGIQVAVVSGSFYEMGIQQGTLLENEIRQNLRAFNHSMQLFGIEYERFEQMWAIQKEYASSQSRDFILGTADALGISESVIGVLWVWEGVIYANRCSSFCLWGDATKTGELIHVRSLDSFGTICDPVLGVSLQENAVVMVCVPDDGFAFLYPTFAGYGVEDGFNEMGVSVCNLWSENSDGSSLGSPMGIRLFDALWSSSSGLEAVEKLTENKTFGYNFVVGDASIPEAFAVETTKTLTYVGCWDDDAEAASPFFQIKDVIRRSNCYINSSLASFQRPFFNPRDVRYLLGMAENYGSVNSWLRYKGMSTAIKRGYGSFDVNSSLEVMRNLYAGRYHPLWWALRMSSSDIPAWWQWSASPGSGDIMLSFANTQNYAQRTEPVLLNLFDLIDML